MKQENAYKIKLLKLLEILRQDSDEDHYIGTTELIDKLADMGIVCDRRTLYKDIEVLNNFGYEVAKSLRESRIAIVLPIEVSMFPNCVFLWMRCKRRALLRRVKRKFCLIRLPISAEAIALNFCKVISCGLIRLKARTRISFML